MNKRKMTQEDHSESVRAITLRHALSTSGLGIDVITEDGDCVFLSLASLAALILPPIVNKPSKASSICSEDSISSGNEKTVKTRVVPAVVDSPPSSRESSEAPSRSSEERYVTVPVTSSTEKAFPPLQRRELQNSYRPYPPPTTSNYPRTVSLPVNTHTSHLPLPLRSRSTSDYFSYSHANHVGPHRENLSRYQNHSEGGGGTLPFPSMRRGRPLGVVHSQDHIQEKLAGRTSSSAEDGRHDTMSVNQNGRTALHTVAANTSLEFVWAPRLGRCVAPDSAMARSEETEIVVLDAGEWLHVYEGSMEMFPWTANGNSWIKGQVKGKHHCICGFAFNKGGQEKDFKRPSVIREHLAHCHRLAPDDKLAQICRYTRQADKALRTSRTRRMQNEAQQFARVVSA